MQVDTKPFIIIRNESSEYLKSFNLIAYKVSLVMHHFLRASLGLIVMWPVIERAVMQ